MRTTFQHTAVRANRSNERSITLADLPLMNSTRWVARRKAEVVAAVHSGLLSLDERSLLRRAEVPAADGNMARECTAKIGRSTAAGWHFDSRRRSLSSPDGQVVPLTTAECDLLTELVMSEGCALSRIDLSRRVFNRHWHPFDRSLDGIVVKLRRKLEPDPDNPTVIKTVRGKGYIFTGFTR